MQNLGLSRAGYEAYLAALRADQIQMDIEVSLLNQNEEHTDYLTGPSEAANMIVEGSVDVDASADISRQLSLTLLDPRDRLRFEANSPAHGAIFADRYIAVKWCVWVEEEVEDWVKVPVFWGPVTKFSREGPRVTIEGMGKESRLLAPHYTVQGYMIHKGERLDDVIERVTHKTGERRFDLPRLKHRIKEKRAVQPGAEPWKILKGGEADDNGKTVQGLVESAPGHLDIGYDPRGRLSIRKRARHPSLKLRWDRDLTAEPTFDYDIEAFRNAVRVRTSKTKGKGSIDVTESLPNHHPLSPKSLAHNGDDVYFLEVVDADELKSEKEARKRAKEELDRLSKEGVSVQCECLPMPHVEEGDQLQVQTADYLIDFALRSFTIPLVPGEPMSINFNKRVRRLTRSGGSGFPHPGRGGTGGSRGGRGHHRHQHHHGGHHHGGKHNHHGNHPGRGHRRH